MIIKILVLSYVNFTIIDVVIDAAMLVSFVAPLKLILILKGGGGGEYCRFFGSW